MHVPPRPRDGRSILLLDGKWGSDGDSSHNVGNRVRDALGNALTKTFAIIRTFICRMTGATISSS